jgi:hypothetical protein
MRSGEAVALEEIVEDSSDRVGAGKGHEMIGVSVAEHRHFALRYQAVGFLGHRGIDQRILVTLDDQGRALVGPKDPPKRPLVGVVEVAGILDGEEPTVEGAEVGDRVLNEPDPAKLEAVDRMVQVVVTEEFILLGPDRGQQGERRDPVRRPVREVEDHPAAHTEADKMSPVDVERVHQ